MPRPSKHHSEHRYYLLPGMGRSNRRRHRQILVAAILVGLAGSAVLAALLFWVNRR